MSKDTIYRQDAIDVLKKCHKHCIDPFDSYHIDIEDAEAWLRDLPSAQSEQHEIGYFECSNAMLKMWIDNVLTDGEYGRIMDKLNAHWAERREE